MTKSGELRGARFAGIDFSLAPFPAEAASIGAAFERLGVARVGLAGSALAAALLTQAIDRAVFPRAGFCGLFLPIFEDAILARRAGEGVLALSDLLLYCTMCGTGLDTIPLPGETPRAAVGFAALRRRRRGAAPRQAAHRAAHAAARQTRRRPG